MRLKAGSGGSHCGRASHCSAGLGDRPGGDSLLPESLGCHQGQPKQVRLLVERPARQLAGFPWQALSGACRGPSPGQHPLRPGGFKPTDQSRLFPLIGNCS